METTSVVGRQYPAPKDWANHQRITSMLVASVRLEQEKLTLEAMREAVRKQEALVEYLRDKEYEFRLLK